MTDLQLWHRCREVRDSGKHLSGGVLLRAGITDTAGVWEDERLICCDGSDTWQEWVGNTLVYRTTKEGCHVSYDRSARGFFRQLVKIIRGHERWKVGGFSRGGAIARKLALELAKMGLSVECVTFGAPPTGKHRLNDLIEDHGVECRGYEIDGDIVPRLPMWWPKPTGEIIHLPRQHKGIKENHMAYGEALAGECCE
jgi:hypothetical protein